MGSDPYAAIMPVWLVAIISLLLLTGLFLLVAWKSPDRVPSAIPERPHLVSEGILVREQVRRVAEMPVSLADARELARGERRARTSLYGAGCADVIPFPARNDTTPAA